ncbi:MAG: OmpA family protein [Chlorobi bacterium]|nr:OmpA family protein [Chlorobiota bacterium]
MERSWLLTPDQHDPPGQFEESEREELLVRFIVPQLGWIDITAYRVDGKLYLPLGEIFSFLKIRTAFALHSSKVSGIFSGENIRFLLDLKARRITLGDTIREITTSDFITTDTELYLRRQLFGEIFGLECTFNELDLEVVMTTSRSLPVFRIVEREKRREQMLKKAAPVAPQHVIPRDRVWLGGGMLDWSVNYLRAPSYEDIVVSGGIGGEVAGGDLTAFATVSRLFGVDWSRQPWRWRYIVDSDLPLRQVAMGHMATSLGFYSGIQGITITNAPEVPRRSFETYTLTDTAEADWEVELYMNHQLVDYTVVDSTGNFSFTVPLWYGTNTVKLKLYGPNGEEEIREQYIEIPAAQLPTREYEYTVKAGVLSQFDRERIGQVSARWGLGPRITAGGGVSILNDQDRYLVSPVLTTSIRIMDDLIFSGAYVRDISARGKLRFASASQFYAGLEYNRYFRNDVLYLGIRREDKRMYLGYRLPTYISKNPLYLNFSLNEYTYEYNKSLVGNVNSQVYFLGLRTQFQTQVGWSGPIGGPYEKSFFQTILTVSTRWLDAWFRPQLVIDHQRGEMLYARLSAERYLFDRAYLQLLLFKDFRHGYSGVRISFRMDVPFAESQTSFDVQASYASFRQSFRGALGFDTETADILYDNRNWVGTSGITIVPFLDDNGNGRHDPDERQLKSRVDVSRINGRRYAGGSLDLSRFVQLNPYDKFTFSLDPNSFVDPVWRPRYISYEVITDPNRFKRVEVPVYVSGEAGGTVYIIRHNRREGQHGINVRVLDEKGAMREENVTFSDGSYVCYNLPPGKYRAELDTVQLNKLGLVPDSLQRSFELRPVKNGDVVSGVDFTLRPATPQVTERVAPDTTIIITRVPVPRLETRVDTLIGARPGFPPAHPVPELPAVPLNEVAHFPVDLQQDGLPDTLRRYLDRIVAMLKKDPNLFVMIHGHSDNFGTFQQNQERSEARMKRVKEYLLDKGIRVWNMEARAFGSRRPIAPNTTAEGRIMNNRVDISVVRK